MVRSAASQYDDPAMTLKAVFLIALGLIGGAAAGLHFFAPELMRHLGQALHGR
jgi:hypothetical protein